MKSVRDLNFRLIDTGFLSENSVYQDKLFDFWKESWEKTFSLLEVYELEELSSDDFLCKRAISLWEGEEPIGVIFLETFDLSQRSHLETSYLQAYPKSKLLNFVQNRLTKAYAFSNLTVRHDWRKSQTDLHVSQLLTSLGFWIISEEKGDLALSCVRNERKVNEVFANHGSVKIGEGFRYNCDVDFIYIPMDMASIFPSVKIEKVCRELLGQQHNVSGTPGHRIEL